MTDVRPRDIRRRFRIAALALLILTPAAGLVAQTIASDYEDEPINYLKAAPRDAIAELQDRIDRGQVQLKFDGKHGYLLSVLQSLNVPLSSQMLVFSKTSFQRDLISPSTPRALYFNDRVYVGWVQGGDYVEISSVDPELGTVFYLLPQTPTGAPKFVRQTNECLQCHDSSMAGGAPGNLMRSVYSDRKGYPILSAGTYLTSDQSPMRERWGGWYVTGRSGSQFHMGNQVARSEADPDRTDWSKGTNVTDLSRFVDTSPYLGRTSDIVALMVAEHQTQTQNRITRAGFDTRRALYYEQTLNKELGRPANYRSDSVTSRIQSGCEPLVRALLFVDEAKLTEPVVGTSGFAERFASFGPFDRRHRSLREFDLKRRLFRYPCSYQIYSAAFDALPDEAKQYVFRRFEESLTGKDKSADFAHLTPIDREAILEILRDTKPDFAAWDARRGKP